MKNNKHDNVKCDCGHYKKDHFSGEGSCDKCGCTFYYPNVSYIKKQIDKKKGKRERKRIEKEVFG